MFWQSCVKQQVFITPQCVATAIIVMDPEDGYELALRENLPTFLIIREKDSFVEKMTPAFKKCLTPDEYRSNH